MLQGIDNYNYSGTLIDGLTVTNNVVMTQACAGILFSTIANATIAGNTVIDDGLPRIPGIACVPSISVQDTNAMKAPNFLPVDHDVRVFNNLASGLAINQLDVNVSAYNNVLVHGKGGAIAMYQNGKPGKTAASYTFAGKPGPLPTLGHHNIIDTDGAASEFTTWSPSTLTYNLTPKPGSLAAHNGTPVGASLTNINGVRRALPPAAVVVGAY